MKALVTGADGFVGRHLMEHLATSGDDAVGVDRECDVTDPGSVFDVLERVRPDVIYHLAALTAVGESWSDPVEYTRVNVLGTKNVLDAARDVAPSARVVLVSSADVYGVVTAEDLPLVETFRVAPANPYASSKMPFVSTINTWSSLDPSITWDRVSPRPSWSPPSSIDFCGPPMTALERSPSATSRRGATSATFATSFAPIDCSPRRGSAARSTTSPPVSTWGWLTSRNDSSRRSRLASVSSPTRRSFDRWKSRCRWAVTRSFGERRSGDQRSRSTDR